MTNAQPNVIAHWQDLNAQADAGTITIPAGVAKQCDTACATYIEHLEQMKRDALALNTTKSWGDLPSAEALRDKFLRLATGTDRSLDVILQQHIDVIDSMRMLFRRYFDETAATDDQTSANIAALSPEN